MDKRELILARIFLLLGRVTGVEEAVRDRGELLEAKRPCIVLLDGTESADASIAGRGRGRAIGPNVVTLEPQIFVLLKSKGPKNEGIGLELSDFRVAIIKALKDDDILLNLLGQNGELLYRGSDTDMQTGSTMQGQLQMNFAFRYVLNPADL